jgi:hypothetical protein
MHNRKPSARDILKGVLYEHIDLALEILQMVNSLSTGDRTYRFQITALVIFLSGIDKTLSLAFQLLYLAGKVDWSWLTKGYTPPSGCIVCNQGLTAKLKKLTTLGLDITDLQWIIDLRNVYIHSCNIYAGYSIKIDDYGALELRPSEPTVSYPLPPLVGLRHSDIQRYAEYLIEAVGTFLDRMEWQVGWNSIARQVACLPINPEPEYSQIADNLVEESNAIFNLNRRFIGDGFKNLI